MELFKPYRLNEETDAFVVYEFRAGFLYLLYGILLTIGVGYFTQQNPISCTGIGLMVLYLCTVTTQCCNLSKKISQSVAGTYKYRGSLGDATGYATASMQRVQSSGWFLYWPTDFSQRQQRLHLVPSALVTE